MRFSLGPLTEPVNQRLDVMAEREVVRRIRERDPTVWSDDPATPELANRLGWLTLPDTMRPRLGEVTALAEEVRRHVDQVVLCGMGGSSLAPEVMWQVLGAQPGYPGLRLLDSTHPDAVRDALAQGDRTLYLIASKSGTTLETRCFQRACWERAGRDGSRFVAVTDPETALAGEAAGCGYRRTFINPPDIGGRFSALSLFGLVPAALLGADVRRLLAQASAVAESPEEYVRLGVVMGEGARAGRDKLTLFLSPGIRVLGLWLEQLVAESTGKRGTGVLPVVEPVPAPPDRYGPDRVFVRVRLEEEEGGADLSDVIGAGHPVVDIRLAGPDAVAGAFYGWEMATAVAGHVLGVNPFDQPNVAESKANTARVLAEGGPSVAPVDAAGLRQWADGVEPADYVAVMAYLPPVPELDQRLARLQAALRERTGTAVTVGYGPRFLHSTGQFHKGGPPCGHFLQIVNRAAAEYPVPGESFGFRELINAQADGDLQALRDRGRPVIRAEGLEPVERELRA